MTVAFTLKYKDTQIHVDLDDANTKPKPVVEDDACTQGRKYAYGEKGIADLVGVSARIKTRYPVTLCCEAQGGTDAAYGVAYCNVSGPEETWAQSGFGRERTQGSAHIQTYRYAEVQGENYQVIYDTDNAPPNDSLHVYRCELSPATGRWSFYYDDVNWVSYVDPQWTEQLGDRVLYVGEIYNQEDSMPGTAANKCNFTACQYRVRDSDEFADVGFEDPDMHTDDAHLWGVERVSASAMNIWNIG